MNMKRENELTRDQAIEVLKEMGFVRSALPNHAHWYQHPNIPMFWMKLYDHLLEPDSDRYESTQYRWQNYKERRYYNFADKIIFKKYVQRMIARHRKYIDDMRAHMVTEAAEFERNQKTVERVMGVAGFTPDDYTVTMGSKAVACVRVDYRGIVFNLNSNGAPLVYVRIGDTKMEVHITDVKNVIDSIQNVLT